MRIAPHHRVSFLSERVSQSVPSVSAGERERDERRDEREGRMYCRCMSSVYDDTCMTRNNAV